MKITFTKMHGLGNDFVVVDGRVFPRRDWEELAHRLADRRFGVGCDQVLVIGDSDTADVRMDIYNADGSRVEMCGNGIRCLAMWLRDRGEWTSDRLEVETLAGVIVPRPRGALIEVDMGLPRFDGREIPVAWDGPVRDHSLRVGDRIVGVTCVSMGNHHAVVFVEDVDPLPIAELGSALETHPFFPQRTNVEFVQVSARNRLRMRVWERGAGITAACGTGACAALVAAQWTGRADRAATVALDGGELDIRWEPETGHVFMTGPATTVFEGEFAL